MAGVAWLALRSIKEARKEGKDDKVLFDMRAGWIEGGAG